MLHRKEFICRFLRLFCLFFLVEREQERNIEDSETVSLDSKFIAKNESFNLQKETHLTCTLEENFLY